MQENETQVSQPATYEELMAKASYLISRAEELKQAAEKIRQEERRKIVQEVRDLMASYGVTVEELQSTGHKRQKKEKVVGVVRYRFGEQTWGGLGKRPNWLKEQLEQGRALEEFAVNPVE